MYRINFQTTTAQSQEKRIKILSLFQQSRQLTVCTGKIKGSRSLITAFMVLALFFTAISCENEGVVGGELNQGEDRVETNTYDVDDIEMISDNGFSGFLTNSGMGVVNDPSYGTITASSLLKPSIIQEEIETFSGDYSLKLMLQLNSQQYGEENSTSQYSIYEIDERWRGREIRYNDPVAIDESNLIGSFQITDEDSVEVPINPDYADRFREFFNDTTALRDSLYRFEFPGIAIVPDDQNSKIDFLRHQQAEDDTTETTVTRFIVENEEDSLVATLPVLDQGSSMVRSNVPEETDGFILHNTVESIMRVDLDLDSDGFEGREIVNAQLIFNVDTEPDQNAPPGFVRPENEFIRGHSFESEPLSLHSEIFARQSTVGANLDEDDNVFRVNITQYLVDHIYGEQNRTSLYFTNQGNNGLYVSTTLMGIDAPENMRPRLIITTINPDN